jgi:hypothetical protein
MRFPTRRVVVVASVLLIAGATTLALFTNTSANSGNTYGSAADFRAPTVDRAVIQPNGGNNGSAGYVKQGQSYFVYANVTDTGNPASGISSVTANVCNVTSTSCSAVAMTAGSYTVNSVTYTYRSAALTASNPLAEGSKSYSITAADAASNSSNTSFNVTVDNTGPTVTRQIACGGDGCTTTGYVGASKTYYVYAQVSDSASGVNTVTTDPRTITAAASATTAMSSSGGPWTIGGNSYNYRTAQLTADSGLADASTKAYTVTASDNLSNSTSPSANATVDNVAPTFGALNLYKTFGRLGGGIRAGGTYFFYADLSDNASGIETDRVTLDASQLTAGKTSVPMCYSASGWNVPDYGSPGTATYDFKPDNDGSACDGTFTPLTTDAGIANGTVTTSTISFKDNAGNSATGNKNITVSNTAGAANTVDIRNTGGGTTGRLELNDQIILTTNDSLDPESVLAGWLGNVSSNVVVRLTDGGGSCIASSDQLQFWNAANTAQLNLGSICLGGTGYNTSGSTITFGATGTPSTIIQSVFTVVDTITLGTPSATAATQAGNTTAVWTPSGSMYDQAGTNYSTSPSPGSTIDNTAPTISAARICGGTRCSNNFVGQGKTYFIYANATDANAGIDGTNGVKADVSNVTTGASAVALTTCSSGCTVNGTTYTYKSAQQTANSTLSGTPSWSVTATDNGSNQTTSPQTVTVDNTAPTVSNSVIAKSTGTGLYLSGKIKQGGTYYVYANVTDASSGLDTVTANVNNITTGQTTVALSPGSFSVNGTSYNYRSAALTANGTLTNGAALGYSVTGTDNAVNVTTLSTPTVTVDNTVPTANTTTKVAATNQTGTVSKPDIGDRIVYTYSEQIDPESILAGWTGASINVTVRVNNNIACPGSANANDNVTIFNTTNATQANIGCVDLLTTGYVAANVTFGQQGSTTLSTMSQSGNAITVTLGSTTGTTTAVAGTRNMIWWPSASAFDAAGNAETTTSQTETDNDTDF